MATSIDLLSWCKASRLTLLIAPPGWGKTSLLLRLIPIFERVIVFISPLKALNLEFSDRLRGHGVEVFLVSSKRELRERCQDILHGQVIILSYEHIVGEFIQCLENNPQKFFLVFDEFHLLFQWGSSFRPQLWESFYQLAETGQSCLALSATVDKEILYEMKQSFLSCFQRVQVVDQGNFELLNPPTKIYGMRGTRDMLIHLRKNLDQGRRCLVFLPYRSCVRQLMVDLSSQGWEVLSCVGGEALAFRQALKSRGEKRVDVILSTSVLSHGVNLPTIDALFIAYREVSESLWWQMVGRGGRKQGESYRLYCMNFYRVRWWKRMVAWLRNITAVTFSWQRIP